MESDLRGQQWMTWFLWKEGATTAEIDRRMVAVCGEHAALGNTMYNWENCTECDQQGQRWMSWFLWKEGVTPAEIHRRLVAVCGEFSVTGKTVYNWMDGWRQGRTSTEKRTGLGRKMTVTTPGNTARVERSIQQNKCITFSELEVATGLSQVNVHRIVPKDHKLENLSVRTANETAVVQKMKTSGNTATQESKSVAVKQEPLDSEADEPSAPQEFEFVAVMEEQPEEPEADELAETQALASPGATPHSSE